MLKTKTLGNMMDKLTRRQWLLGSTITGLSMGAAACSPKKGPMLSARARVTQGVFAHGIASGDPLPNAVILWTRITPDDVTTGPTELLWEVSENESFASLTASGTVMASTASNWTTKIDATGLPSGSALFYRFKHGETYSPIGRTKTLPQGDINSVRFAVVSCSNWQHGYFNAYDHISRQDDIDAVIHLGDYYYEYAATGYENTEMGRAGRLHEPPNEIVSLNDYRLRHAQYRSDTSLQAMSAKFPLITIWDDHESTNDSWQGGAQNHNEGEGEWEARKQAAMRAYYEWMPIREPIAGRAREALFRGYSYGDLLSLITVETRLNARAEPFILENHLDEITRDPERFKTNVLGDKSRDMFGQVQEDFIVDRLEASKQSGTIWRVLANQVIMGRLLTPDLEPYVSEEAIQAIETDWPGVRDMVTLSKYNLPLYPDSWDGYPAARDHFFDRLETSAVNDVFVLTGDAHEFWLNNLSSQSGRSVGLECVTTSVSSETLVKYMGDTTADYSLLLTQSNEDARYYNALHNGYMDITFGRTKADVKMMAVSTVFSQDYYAFEAAGFTVKHTKDGSLKASGARGLNLKQKALFVGIG